MDPFSSWQSCSGSWKGTQRYFTADGSRPKSICRQGSGRAHHGYGYDPKSDGWKVDCSTPTQRSFSTYTMAKPEVAPLPPAFPLFAVATLFGRLTYFAVKSLLNPPPPVQPLLFSSVIFAVSRTPLLAMCCLLLCSISLTGPLSPILSTALCLLRLVPVFCTALIIQIQDVYLQSPMRMQ